MKGKLFLKGLSILSAVAITFSGVMAEPVLAENFRGDITIATTSNAGKRVKDTNLNEVIYNLGSREIKVAENRESSDADWTFDENGNFQIYVGDSNPYFPLEVQFKYQDKVSTEWFMTPDDSVVVAGHTFTLKLRDASKYTSYKLEIGGKVEVLYPEKKEFTNENGSSFRIAGGVKRRSRADGGNLDVDLKKYTPLELTRVQMSGMFNGIDLSNKKIMWTLKSDKKEKFKVNNPEDRVDLSVGVTESYSKYWNVLIGDDDQLSDNVTSYNVHVIYGNGEDKENWLKSALKQSVTNVGYIYINPTSEVYEDNTLKNRGLVSNFDKNSFINKKIEGSNIYLSLNINAEKFPDFDGSTVIYYEGRLKSESDIASAKNITAQIKSGTYEIDAEKDVELTIVQNVNGQITGFLPIIYDCELNTEGIYNPQLYDFESTNNDYNIAYSDITRKNNWSDIEFTLYPYYENRDLSRECRFVLNLKSEGKKSNGKVVAAYVGEYKSIEAAQDAGSPDIHLALFSDRGYKGVYSSPIVFTVFTITGNVYYVRVSLKKRPEPLPSGPVEPYRNSDTRVQFRGLKNASGQMVPGYFVNATADSYGEYNYQTIMVADDVDLSNVAPVFYKDETIKLYVAGSSVEEVSGESYHDLSSGMIQYTASAEDKEHQGNYWLQIVKPSANGGFYFNSLADKDAKTSIRDGVIYTTREVMLDRAHGDVHDIIGLNIGNTPIEKLSAELESTTLALDDYWTLKGVKPLSQYIDDPTANGDMNLDERLDNRPVNMVDIRLKRADGVKDGTLINGTLRIKSDDKLIAEVTLTGLIGSPIIITEDIPAAVKYVPYGTMIQNNNKYSWNVPTYYITKGNLPEGMELKKNGELYGVPKEAGEFKFEVTMELEGNSNSLSRNNETSDSKEFTLKVAENTDPNVEAATDTEYYLRPDNVSDGIGRVPNISPNATETEYLMVSNGAFAEYKDVYLDGEKLVRGVDYTANSGSTRLTIKAETLKRNGDGVHTLGMEFRDSRADTSNTSESRTDKEGNLKKAAQNYRVSKSFSKNSSGGHSSSGKSSGGSSGGGRSSSGKSSGKSNSGKSTVAQSTSTNNTATNVTNLPYANTSRPNTEGHWVHDGKNWTFKYNSDNKNYTGWIVSNSRWYYLNDEGILQSGWQNINGSWYLFHYTDDATLGALEVGWNNFNGKWYNLSTVDDDTMGRMYVDTTTPDGYRVGSDGSWNGETR